ncbi:MAG UNVERIFIED_CONTAM: hypothetical protein LVQ98_00775 [Rickettsiaceae bacterium]|jgi:hypothetical protein
MLIKQTYLIKIAWRFAASINPPIKSSMFFLLAYRYLIIYIPILFALIAFYKISDGLKWLELVGLKNRLEKLSKEKALLQLNQLAIKKYNNLIFDSLKN